MTKWIVYVVDSSKFEGIKIRKNAELETAMLALKVPPQIIDSHDVTAIRIFTEEEVKSMCAKDSSTTSTTTTCLIQTGTRVVFKAYTGYHPKLDDNDKIILSLIEEGIKMNADRVAAGFTSFTATSYDYYGGGSEYIECSK